MYKSFGTVKTRNCIYIHRVTENVLITSKIIWKRKILGLYNHTTSSDKSYKIYNHQRGSNLSALHCSESNISLCTLHISVENWHSLAPPQCVSVDAKELLSSVEEECPSWGLEGFFQPPGDLSLVPPDPLQLDHPHDVLVLVYQLGTLLPCLHVKNNTSVKNSSTYPKNIYT